MRLALYGGSFNPPHIVHQLTCLYVLETARPRFDALWLVPTFEHAFDKPLAPFADRVAMCERLAAPLGPRVAVSRIEEQLGGASYTLRTVEALRARHADLDVHVVIGADLLAELPRWHRHDELVRQVSFVVVGRSGAASPAIAPGAPAPPDGGPGIDMPAVSSTEVRARFAAGQPLDRLVPSSVVDYVRERGLYGAVRS